MNFRKRSQGNIGHSGKLIVGDLFLALNLFDPINISIFHIQPSLFIFVDLDSAFGIASTFFLSWNNYITKNPICKEVFEIFFRFLKNFSEKFSKRG
jgi:hypothetical protein